MSAVMPQIGVPGVFMRGGTSKGVFFHARDLPAEVTARDDIFRAALGSPDPYDRQLDGLGGGISSLSKAVVIAPSERPGVDVDFTFAQVDIHTAMVDYGSTCGNLSSAVGPFAVDEGLVQANGTEALVRIYNTNTDKIFESRFSLVHGKAAVAGDLAIPGVAGSGAPVRLDFVDPGGAGTGRLLPTGAVTDVVDVPDLGSIEVSAVDATNLCVFVAAGDLGLTGAELPQELDADPAATATLEAIRAEVGVRLGLGTSAVEVSARSKSSPKVAIVAPPGPARTIDGGATPAEGADIGVRMLSMGRCHKAVPLTGGMCLAVAAQIEGSIPQRMLGPVAAPGDGIRIGTPSGVLPIGAEVGRDGNRWRAERVVVYRTARRLMDGRVLIPSDLFPLETP